VFRGLFRQHRDGERSNYDGLTCPRTGRRFATRDTDPIEWNPVVDHGTGVATYDCQLCGGRHAFLWGPRTPALLVDADDRSRWGRGLGEEGRSSRVPPPSGPDDGPPPRG
jgi:hypothetical protein